MIMDRLVVRAGSWPLTNMRATNSVFVYVHDKGFGAITPRDRVRVLPDKHDFRKHGSKAYYGQVRNHG